MKTRLGALVLGLGALGLALHAAQAAQRNRGEKQVTNHVFELRTYHVAPGKMDALNGRFRHHTNKLFRKHGMHIVGFWTPTDPAKGRTTLIYLLSFPSKEAAERSWELFRADPEWKAVKEQSEKDGKLVEKVESVFLNPTEYSPLK